MILQHAVKFPCWRRGGRLNSCRPATFCFPPTRCLYSVPIFPCFFLNRMLISRCPPRGRRARPSRLSSSCLRDQATPTHCVHLLHMLMKDILRATRPCIHSAGRQCRRRSGPAGLAPVALAGIPRWVWSSSACILSCLGAKIAILPHSPPDSLSEIFRTRSTPNSCRIRFGRGKTDVGRWAAHSCVALCTTAIFSMAHFRPFALSGARRPANCSILASI